MNKTYRMNNEVRNNFRRMLKDVSQNSDLSWNENAVCDEIVFEVTGNENAVALVDKFNEKMNTVRLTVRAKSKFEKKLQKIVSKLNGKFVVSNQKNYFIVIMDRANQNAFKDMIAEHEIESKISCDGVSY